MTTKTKTAKTAAAAKAAKVNPDAIVESKGIVNGDKHYVKSADGQTLTFPTARWHGELRELSAVGASFSKLETRWKELSVAKLANGVAGRAAPHAAKAVADAAAKVTAKAVADAAAKVIAKAKTAKTAKAKAEAKKAAKAEADTRKLSLSEKGEAKLAKLSAADRKKDRLQLMVNAGSVEAALALNGVGRGDVNYAIKCGLMLAK